MADHFNRLTPAQAEVLALLAEECGELVQAIGKTLRHGADSRHPSNPDEPNIEAVAREYGDVMAAFHLVTTQFGTSGDGWTLTAVSEEARAHKLSRVQRYLHHAGEVNRG